MIRISQLKLPIGHKEEDFIHSIAKTLKVSVTQIKSYDIIKKSIDARKKDEIIYIYTLDVDYLASQSNKEEAYVKRLNHPNISLSKDVKYVLPTKGKNSLSHRPVVVGSGPAGLFCTWLLAKQGYSPLMIERGEEVDQRVQTVEHFWSSQELNTESNVQFGEGGAGTFSDGKLNTMVREAKGRYQLVLDTFVEHGAPSEIRYLNKPHIGTNKLRLVVKHMREDIVRLGGEVRFNTKLTDLIIKNNQLSEIVVNDQEHIPCHVLVPAIGHSARDTFAMFLSRGLLLTPKAFAIGLRIEHKQNWISHSQYGNFDTLLPPADYKLTHQTKTGRGVYSFCMCPGGYVVNASSEQGLLAVNGMSNYERDADNANSAIVVTVQPKDFGEDDPLSGVAFQRNWEQLAFQTGGGLVPVQLFGDLLENKESVTIGNVAPSIQGGYRLSNLNQCLPEWILDSIKEGIIEFDKKIKGFGSHEAVLSAVETRTSSPVRVLRDEGYESNIKGIYPCGEGAGYAGGITSAAIDGIKVFEAISSRFNPQY